MTASPSQLGERTVTPFFQSESFKSTSGNVGAGASCGRCISSCVIIKYQYINVSRLIHQYNISGITVFQNNYSIKITIQTLPLFCVHKKTGGKSQPVPGHIGLNQVLVASAATKITSVTTAAAAASSTATATETAAVTASFLTRTCFTYYNITTVHFRTIEAFNGFFCRLRRLPSLRNQILLNGWFLCPGSLLLMLLHQTLQMPAEARPLPWSCLLYTSPSPRDRQKSRMPSSA
eukprot:TRINITY_DN17721_c0_g1_i2.p2 TRINITY_DN17721_c0_g1~~TRINITY_DN17721_c0_g1_i2.p2  ORF type:complete len:234 (-),score=13.24 TRINITY_DN17721_c0_g1_i2:24-725(-)